MLFRSRRKSAGSEAEDADVVFEVTEEQILEGGEEVIEASVSGAEVAGRELETEEERTRITLRRLSRLCLGSYGELPNAWFYATGS